VAPFGRTAGGEPVAAVSFEGGGLRATVLAYGATLARLEAPDRGGRLADVVLGFERLEAYEASPAHVGGVVGRWANRIAGARFVLDGRERRLAANEGANQLHGGPVGFDRRVWQRSALPGGEPGAAFELESADGDQGFPGTLRCRAVYRVEGERTLSLVLEARTDAPTPVGLTQHAYWNLGGAGAGPVLDHELEIAADRYLAVDAQHLLVGGLRDVAGTPFDFRTPKPVGRDLDLAHPDLAPVGGYDHPFALRGGEGPLREVARLAHPPSGRAFALSTTAPSLQLYGGQLLARGPGKAGFAHGPHAGLCLEPQRFPDAPNRPDLGPAILRPGELYRWETRWRFA